MDRLSVAQPGTIMTHPRPELTGEVRYRHRHQRLARGAPERKRPAAVQRGYANPHRVYSNSAACAHRH